MRQQLKPEGVCDFIVLSGSSLLLEPGIFCEPVSGFWDDGRIAQVSRGGGLYLGDHDYEFEMIELRPTGGHSTPRLARSRYLLRRGVFHLLERDVLQWGGSHLDARRHFEMLVGKCLASRTIFLDQAI